MLNGALALTQMPARAAEAIAGLHWPPLAVLALVQHAAAVRGDRRAIVDRARGLGREPPQPSFSG